MPRFKVLIIIYFILFIVSSAQAADPSQISAQIEVVRREREALVAEQRRLEAELQAVNRESQNLGTAVKSLDTTRKKLAADIKVTQSKIKSTDLSIQSLENTIGDKETQIVTHEQAIKTAIRNISNYDTKPLWIDMLASTNFADAWRDRTQLEGFSVDLSEEVENLRDTKYQLSEEKKKKEEVKKQIASLHTELSGQKTVVEESQKAKERLLTETKNKEAAYQQMLAENLARQKEFEQDLYSLESELNIAIDPSLIPAARSGIMIWPFDVAYMSFCGSAKNQRELGNSKCVTQRYTYQPFAVNKDKGHNGVDFRAAVGTPVGAISSGIVQGTGNSDDQKNCYSYGRWILIKHNNGLSSIYAHLSASLVQTGQNVKAGDIIGLSGGKFRMYGSGNSQAPHLHLGLFASQGVDIRPFTSARYLQTGIGCNQVRLPTADPKAYLDPLAYLPSL